MEYNDIVFYATQPEFNSINFTMSEVKAIEASIAVKTVRDELSHIRPPHVDDIKNLITRMNLLFPE